MTRDELVDAGAAALVRDGLDALFSTSAQVMSARVVETVEPLIRADERENGEWVLSYREALMRFLRAQINDAPTPVEDGSAYADGWHDALNMATSLIRWGGDE